MKILRTFNGYIDFIKRQLKDKFKRFSQIANRVTWDNLTLTENIILVRNRAIMDKDLDKVDSTPSVTPADLEVVLYTLSPEFYEQSPRILSLAVQQGTKSEFD